MDSASVSGTEGCGFESHRSRSFWQRLLTHVVYRLFPKKVDLKQLVKFYDKDGDGCISYYEFITGLTDKKLSDRKAIIVEAAWCKITGSKGGCATGKQLADALRDPSCCD